MSKKDAFYEALKSYRDELNEDKKDTTALVCIEVNEHGPNAEVCGSLGAILAGISDLLLEISKRESISLDKIFSGIKLYKAMMQIADLKKSLAHIDGEDVDDDDEDDDEHSIDLTNVETIVLGEDAADEALALVDKLRELGKKGKQCLN